MSNLWEVYLKAKKQDFLDIGTEPLVEMFAIDDCCWTRNDPVMIFANVDSDWWMDLAVWITLPMMTDDKKESSTYFEFV